MNTFVLFT
jgi:hypothetical protein